VKGCLVEVKIGVQNAARELLLESEQSPEAIEAAVQKALEAEHGVLNLVDDRGRRILVPADRLAYVEIGEQVERRVGFGAL
jgi:hypothetical protein